VRARYVVDTNVLIAASAGHPIHPADIEATPADPHLRLKVWEWLDAFNQSSTRLVLDSDLKIFMEYQRKLNVQDFGIQVVMNKWSTLAFDSVDVEYDENGHGVLPSPLQSVVHDNDDKKMVAAALAAHNNFGEEGCIAFAGDTDWHDWEDSLTAHSIVLEPIIEEWSRQKHQEKQNR